MAHPGQINMVVGEWLERAAIDCLASDAMEAVITDRPLCHLLHIIEPVENDGGDESCRALLGDSTYHCMATLGDTPVARLSRRFPTKAFKSFAGCTLEITKGRMQAVVKEKGVVMVMKVEDFVVTGGMIAGCTDVEKRVSVTKSDKVLAFIDSMQRTMAAAAKTAPAVIQPADDSPEDNDDEYREEIIQAACDEPEDLEKTLLVDEDEDEMEHEKDDENILDLQSDDSEDDSESDGEKARKVEAEEERIKILAEQQAAIHVDATQPLVEDKHPNILSEEEPDMEPESKKARESTIEDIDEISCNLLNAHTELKALMSCYGLRRLMTQLENVYRVHPERFDWQYEVAVNELNYFRQFCNCKDGNYEERIKQVREIIAALQIEWCNKKQLGVDKLADLMKETGYSTDAFVVDGTLLLQSTIANIELNEALSQDAPLELDEQIELVRAVASFKPLVEEIESKYRAEYEPESADVDVEVDVEVAQTNSQASVEPNQADITDTLPSQEAVDEPVDIVAEEVVIEPNLPIQQEVIIEPTLPAQQEVVSEPTLPAQQEVIIEPTQPTQQEVIIEPTLPAQQEVIHEPTQQVIQEVIVEPTQQVIQEVIVEPTQPTQQILPIADDINQSANDEKENLEKNNEITIQIPVKTNDAFVKPLPRKRTASAIDYSKWTF